MKPLILILMFFAFNFPFAKGCYKNINKENPLDSISLKAKKLKQLYLLATTAYSNTEREVYKQQFFNEFPNTFKELDELYGYKEEKVGALENVYYEHIYNLFNNLSNINDTLYYRKIVSIAIDGHWDADAINAFQHGLREKILINPDLTIYILKDMSENKIKSFWYFYFDGVHPAEQIPEPLERIKLINRKIYDLMIEAHKDTLKKL